VVKIIARLELDETISFTVGHYIVSLSPCCITLSISALS